MQYLINLTGIWLVSLVVFDLFLRKESYHTYNRIYLLTTMLAGIIFPLIKWQPDTTRFYIAMQKPVANVIAVKSNIVAAAEPATQVSWDVWLLGVYLIGAAVMVSLLFRDTLQLIRYYRAGRRSDIKGWTLVETGKGNAPFSFLNLLFVSSRADYSADEWQMLMDHEGRHTRLLHVVDLVVLQLCRVIFWFHPLVYVYNKRLLMVHEYQADNVGSQQPQVYGRFLVEQAVLHTAPSITHSFNRSPIKKRILMLTKRSTTIARIKMVMVLPLTMACLVLFSHISYSKRFDRQGNKVTYRGNVFELGTPFVDTIILINPVTGGEEMKFSKHDEAPEKMNGKKIYRSSDLTVHPRLSTPSGSLEEYVFISLSPLLNKLPDGNYEIDINNVVVDEKGKIVFYEGAGFREFNNQVTQEMKNAIANEIDEAMNRAPAMKPGQLEGYNVASLYNTDLVNYEIEIKNHEPSLRQIWTK